jgi:hypothetical protein
MTRSIQEPQKIRRRSHGNQSTTMLIRWLSLSSLFHSATVALVHYHDVPHDDDRCFLHAACQSTVWKKLLRHATASISTAQQFHFIHGRQSILRHVCERVLRPCHFLRWDWVIHMEQETPDNAESVSSKNI